MLTLFALSGIFCAHAQLTVEMAGIEDNRGSSFSRCELKLKLSGPTLQNAQFILLDTDLKAVDDKGTELVNDNSFGFHKGEFEPVKVDAESGAMEKEIRLTNPPRIATEITSVKGIFQIYNSNLDPKSKVTVKGFINRPNQSLLTEKNPKLDVLYIDPEAYKFLQQAEKEKVNKQIALLNSQNPQQAKAFVDSFFEFMKAGTGPNTVNFYVKETGQQFFRFEFRDETGELAEPGSTMTGNNYYSFGFRKPVTKDWQVTLLLITPKALQTIPFELRNIKLP